MRTILEALAVITFIVLLIWLMVWAFGYARTAAGCDGYGNVPAAEIPGKCLMWYTR